MCLNAYKSRSHIPFFLIIWEWECKETLQQLYEAQKPRSVRDADNSPVEFVFFFLPFISCIIFLLLKEIVIFTYWCVTPAVILADSHPNSHLFTEFSIFLTCKKGIDWKISAQNPKNFRDKNIPECFPGSRDTK